jgi:hypothetical protein
MAHWSSCRCSSNAIWWCSSPSCCRRAPVARHRACEPWRSILARIWWMSACWALRCPVLVALCQLTQGDAHGRAKAASKSASTASAGLLRHHAVVGADAFEHIDQANLGVRVQPADLPAGARCAGARSPRVRQQSRAGWAAADADATGRDVEAGGANRQVFRVRRFHDQQAARLQRAQRLGGQFLHQRRRQVLDQVEGRHQRQAGVGLARSAASASPWFAFRPRSRQATSMPSSRSTPRAVEAVLAQQLQPFAAAAAEVERGRPPAAPDAGSSGRRRARRRAAGP